jgi:hypothetical protein
MTDAGQNLEHILSKERRNRFIYMNENFPILEFWRAVELAAAVLPLSIQRIWRLPQHREYSKTCGAQNRTPLGSGRAASAKQCPDFMQ